MPLLLDELFTCPNCNVVFQDKILGTYDTFGKSYSDLYIGSEEDPQPVLHHINICPKCGFASFTSDFKTFDIKPTSVKKAIKKVEEYTGKKPSEFNAGDGYLVIIEYSPGISKEEKSYLYLQACYAYRILRDDMLKATREKLLEIILEIIEEEAFDVNPKELYLYLAGELNRLLNKEETSLKYFNEALKLAEEETFISRLIIHQLSKPSEEVPRKLFKQ